METGAAQKITSYRDLVVWEKAMELVIASYQIAKQLPPSEHYGLTSQIQRAAVSIPANIAEGHGQSHLGDYLHHLSVATGSLRELETHVLIACRLSYLKKRDAEAALNLATEVGRMLTALTQRLRSRKASPSASGSET